MVKNNIIKWFISLIVLISILIVFIPIFQELGINFGFMPIFIFGIVLILVLVFSLWIKEHFMA